MHVDGPTAHSDARRRSRGRGFAFRLVLALFALIWLTFGFGIIDFVSGFTSVGEADPLGIGVLSAAYGAVAGIVLPAAFLALMRRPQHRPAAAQQIVAVAIAFAVAGVLGLDPLCFISVAMLVVMLAVVLALHPARPRLLPTADRMSRAVLLVAVLAVLPWVVYALAMVANSRRSLPPEDMAARPQAGGWAGAAVLAFVVVLLAVLAALRTPGWRVPQWSAALASIAFGVTSLLNPELPGSAGARWGALAVTWGLAFALIGEARGDRRGSPPSVHAGAAQMRSRSSPH